jgi:hypothetical protein
MKHICKIYPTVTDFFHKDLKNLSTKLKAKHTTLQQHF